MHRNRLLTAVTAAMATLVTQAAWSASTALEGHTPAFIGNHLDLGAESATKPVRLRIWLKMHQADQLRQAAKDVSDPQSPRYRKFLTKAEIDATYKATAAEVAKVQKYLQSRGLKNVKVDPNKLYVEADGTANDAQNIFQVKLRKFLVDGKTTTANTANPFVDDEIANLVSYVGGLSTHVKRPMIRRQVDLDSGAPVDSTPFLVGPTKTQHNTVCFSGSETHQFQSAAGAAAYQGNRFGSPVTAVAPNLPPCGYGPTEVQAAYGIDKLVAKGLDGRGETVVIVDAFGSPTIEGDADAFSRSYGLPIAQLTVYQPGGVPVVGPWNTDQQGWAGETTLDVEYAHVMAPGAKIALVEALSDADSDLTAAIAYAVENNLGNSISNSWSGNESQEDDASMALTEAVLQTAVARGISVHFSSGDDGDLVKSITYADVGYPSSSRYVTSIGGTSLAMNADHSIQFQTGWGNNGMRIADGVDNVADSAADKNPPLAPPTSLGFVGGSGGGPSRIFPKPTFQKKVVGTTRMQPDISYLADPYTGVELVESNFDAAGNPQPGSLALSTIGGTSLACPMFSGMWAIANQAHGSSLGQAAPLLYKLPKGAIVDIVPVSSATNVGGAFQDDKGVVTSMSPLSLAMPETAAPFFSALYNSPHSPYRWNVISFGTDTSLQTAVGWDNVTGLGVPNGEKFVQALK